MAWIQQQDPECVAEALGLCEGAYKALRSKLSEDEAQRSAGEIEALKQQLSTQAREFQTMLNDTTTSLQAELAAKHEMKLHAIEDSHKRRDIETRQAFDSLIQDKTESIERIQNSANQIQLELKAEIAELTERLSCSESRKRDESKRLIEEHSREISDIQTTLKDTNDAQLAFVKSTYEERIEHLQAEINNVNVTTTQAVEEEREKLKSSHAVQLEQERQKLEAREEHHAALEVSLKQQHEQLRAQLAQQALTTSDLRETLHAQAEVERQTMNQRMDVMTTNYEKQIADMKAQLQESREDLQAVNNEKLDIVKHCNEKIQKISQDKEMEMQKQNQDMRELIDENRGYLSTLAGNATFKGNIGENFIDQVHSPLELGTMENVAKKQRPGYADRLWTYSYENVNIPGIYCTLEAKYSDEMHSVHDLQKFENDIRAAVEANRCNCAMLISLKTRIPNCKQIDVSIVSGIPVVKASRHGHDALSAASLVQLAFTTLHQIWPHLATNMSKNEDLVLDSFCSFLEKQIHQIELIQPRITAMEKASDNLAREVNALRKLRDSMISEVKTLQLKHPQLLISNSDNVELLQTVTDAIIDFKSNNPRRAYPKTKDELNLDIEILTQVTDDVFKQAESRVRKAYKPGPKRKRTDTTTNVEK